MKKVAKERKSLSLSPLPPLINVILIHCIFPLRHPLCLNQRGGGEEEEEDLFKAKTVKEEQK
jgi:hypothetical protein